MEGKAGVWHDNALMGVGWACDKVPVICYNSAFKPVLSGLNDWLSRYIFPFMFTCPSSRLEGKRHSHGIMSKLWKDACKRAGERKSMYAGIKHSSCCQYINEKGLSMSDLQTITDHARLDSVKRFVKPISPGSTK